MAFMDDVKKRTEEGIKTIRDTAEGIAFNVEKQAKIARKKMEIMKIQRRIQKIYGEVGEYVYGEYTMERAPVMESPYIKDRMVAISKGKAAIGNLEEEIEEIRRTQPPSSSGDPGDPGEETSQPDSDTTLSLPPSPIDPK